MNVAAYENGDICDLAATYLYHIAKDHGFVDGNKRTGYLTCLTFLDLNGIDLGKPPCLELATIATAAGLIDKRALTGLLRQLVVTAREDPDYYQAIHAIRPTPSSNPAVQPDA